MKIKRPIKIIYNAINIEINVPIQKELQIIYIGRFEKKKGIGDLLKAFELLEDKKIKLILIGRGNYQLPSNEQIKIIPWCGLENLYKIIKKSLILVIPSNEKETFGRPIIEAVYNGTLPLARSRGAMPEILNYNKDYLFDNVEELVKKIKTLIQLSDATYISEVKSLQSEMTKYSLRKQLECFEEFYFHCSKTKERL